MVDDAATVEELALSPEAASAPAARRLVIAAILHSGFEERSDDASLAVSELVTNAVLHGKEPITLRVISSADGVRVEVHDGNPVSPAFSMLDPTAVTGRGLVLVAAVTDGWGIEPGENGKTVWFTINKTAADAAELAETERLLASWADELVLDPAHENVRVVLTDLDTSLLAASEQHNQDLLRELTILASGERSPAQSHAAKLLESAIPMDAMRNHLRHQVAVAMRDGRPLLDVQLTVRREDAAQVRDFLHAIDDADRLSRAGELLVMPSEPAVKDFRQAFLRRLLDQLRS